MVTVVDDSGGCASGGDSSMKKMNVRLIVLHLKVSRNVKKYLIPCWKTMRTQWNIQGIRTWFLKT